MHYLYEFNILLTQTVPLQQAYVKYPMILSFAFSKKKVIMFFWFRHFTQILLVLLNTDQPLQSKYLHIFIGQNDRWKEKRSDVSYGDCMQLYTSNLQPTPSNHMQFHAVC